MPLISFAERSSHAVIPVWSIVPAPRAPPSPPVPLAHLISRFCNRTRTCGLYQVSFRTSPDSFSAISLNVFLFDSTDTMRGSLSLLNAFCSGRATLAQVYGMAICKSFKSDTAASTLHSYSRLPALSVGRKSFFLLSPLVLAFFVFLFSPHCRVYRRDSVQFCLLVSAVHCLCPLFPIPPSLFYFFSCLLLSSLLSFCIHI